VFYCPHSPDENCECRKPKPGLFQQIGERYGIDLDGVPTAGDSLRDVLAGAAAGCEPHLLLTGMGEACRGILPLPPEYPPGTMVHENLAAFGDFLLAREERVAKAELAAPQN
jgi:D-glycero-D-manno-heptose 1,7-bisphosphate phosphatase